MKQKLTLYLDADAVRRAERYAQRHRMSLSQLVSRFLESLPLHSDEFPGEALTPAVRRLSGLVRSDVDPIREYRHHLIEKHSGDVG